MSLRLIWVIMGLSLVLVGGRTLLAAQSALQTNESHARTKVNRKQDTLVLEVSRSDSLIKATSPSVRNPFQPPPARALPGPVRTGPKPPVAPPPVVPPRAILLMQDGTSTLVQIEVDGETSPRMSVGNSFHGWTITAITDKSIQVTNGSNTFNLARP
jgi:hypothetical protein